MRDLAVSTNRIAVVGGGLAGAAAAITLARAGRNVVLLEAARSPTHKVCGEFLSAEALEDLHSLGIDVDALGAAPIRHVRLCGPHGSVAASLPFGARSLTRRCLDAALLRRAEAAGVTVRRGCRVAKVTRTDNSSEPWHLRTADGEDLRAADVILASGKHDLAARSRPRGVQRGLIGLKMYFRLSPAQTLALAETVELSVYRGGYAGLQPVEDGLANLCCLVHENRFRHLGARWEPFLADLLLQCPPLAERLAAATPLLDRPLAIASIPYGFVRRATEGPWYVGDQAAVIPSFTGDGMSIALHSGRLAAAMLLEGQTAAAFQRRLASELAWQVRLATAVSIGLLTPAVRPALLGVATLWPGSLRLLAKATRVPSCARQQLRSSCSS